MKHGTRWSYLNGCRCDLCTAANTDYHRELRHRRKAGEQGSVRMDGELVREWIEELYAAGWSYRGIALEVGLSDTTVRRIAQGQARVEAVHAAKILNVGR